MRLIDADALLLHLNDVWYSAFVWEATAESKTIRAIMDTIEDAPTVETEQKKGKWIYTDEAMFGNPYGSYKCSVCDNGMPHETNFCPNCGADMRGDSHETD